MSFNEAFHYCAYNGADIFFGKNGYVTIAQQATHQDAEGLHTYTLRARGQDPDPALALVVAVVAMLKKTEAYRLQQISWEDLIAAEAHPEVAVA